MIKRIFIIALFITCTSAVFAQPNNNLIRLSEPAYETEKYELFGEPIKESDFQPAVRLAEIVDSKQKEGPVKLVTTVAQVCQKKGCFFIARDENYTARITFKEYGFFIPTDSEGKEVVLVGEFSVKTLSEDQAKHFAEDAGENPGKISGDQKEYSVVASSIIVPKSK